MFKEHFDDLAPVDLAKKLFEKKKMQMKTEKF